MKTCDLIGKVLLVTRDRRPQGFQFALNLIENWVTNLLEKMERRERLEVGDLWTLRILCPEDFRLASSAFPNYFSSRGDSANKELENMFTVAAWKDYESLISTCELIRDNFNSMASKVYDIEGLAIKR